GRRRGALPHQRVAVRDRGGRAAGPPASPRALPWRNRPMSRPIRITGVLAAVYLGLAALGTFWGPAAIAPGSVVRTVAAAVGLADAADVSAGDQIVVLQLRLPQVVLLGLVGAALACSGAALQATFENPLADPGVLGVTGGAALGAVLVIHTGLTERVALALPVGAFAGATAAALMVYALAHL